MIRNLADEHDEWWKLKADPGRASIVVEEALRLASPTQGLYRKVTRDVEIEGTSIPAGDRLLVMFAAADRDPADVPRSGHVQARSCRTCAITSPSGTASTSASVHRSPGWRAVVALEKLVERFDDFKLAGRNTFEFEPSFILRGLKDLYVEFTPAASTPS